MTAEQAVVEAIERAFLRGMRWTDLADAVIDENFANLPLLTPEAFAYYVPAYIRRAVLEPRVVELGSGMVLQFTIYALCDVEVPRDEFWRERVERFTPQQEQAIVTFLRWAVSLEATEGIDDPGIDRARRGLAEYWEPRVRVNP